MKFGIQDLKTERQSRAATGMDKARFFKLSDVFKKCYLDIYGTSLKDRQMDNGAEYCINSEEDLLLYTLFSLKSGLTYDVLGLVSGMDGSNAKRNQDVGLKVLGKTLATLGCLPKRNFMNKKDFEDFFADEEQLILDASEQGIQRPSDKEQQKMYYSGKKKRHTLKVMVISIKSKIIRYISACREGRVHDYQLLKDELPSEQNWFENFSIKVDLGYIGIMKDYLCKSIAIPHKKTKTKPLTDSQKEENKQMASERIKVEHSIGGLKRYRILSDRLRIHLIDLYDDILGVCAGFWNFYLTN